MKLVLLSCGWIAGILLGSRVTFDPYVIFPLFAIPLLLLLFLHKKQTLVWGGVCLIVLLGGILRFDVGVSESTIQLYNEVGVVQVRGIVDRDPEYEGTTTSIYLSAREIDVGNGWARITGGILVYVRGTVFYSRGDELLVTGELQAPPDLEGFDYPAYLASQGTYSTMLYPEVDLEGRGWLSGFRNRLSQSLAAALPEPQGSLAQALLLGIRSHVPESLMESFRTTGTAHIIAISGLHVAILGGMVLGAGAWLFGRQRPTYILVTLGVVWLYALIAGMGPPVFRAAIMFTLFILALWLGRPRRILPALALAAAVMVGIDPQSLWDVSFQLSFLAVIGLVFLVPPLLDVGKRSIVVRVREGSLVSSVVTPVIASLAVTLAAIIATSPLIAYYFGYVSFLSLPATLFALPALPGVIITGVLVAGVGLVAPAVAHIIGWGAWLFLSYVIEVVESFASLPFASSHIDGLDGAWIWAYYGLLASVLWIVPSRKGLSEAVSKASSKIREGLGIAPRVAFTRAGALVTLILVALVVWTAVILTAHDERLEVSFLDVGQGDSILIETPAGQQILIDGGPDPEKVCLELGKRLPFWDKSLDLVVLTHPEDDHIAGIVEVLQRYQVGQVLEPGIDCDSISYRELLGLIEGKGIDCTVASEGQRIELGNDISIDVLYPQGEYVRDSGMSLNDNSVVLYLEWKEVGFLFTGDIGEGPERELLHQGVVRNSNVLKVAHHGSSTSTCARFLSAVEPQLAVICVGQENPFGHPSPDVLDRLVEEVGQDRIYTTSEHGTVTVFTDGVKLWVESER